MDDDLSHATDNVVERYLRHDVKYCTIKSGGRIVPIGHVFVWPLIRHVHVQCIPSPHSDYQSELLRH